jgi:hypothetical protein
MAWYSKARVRIQFWIPTQIYEHYVEELEQEIQLLDSAAGQEAQRARADMEHHIAEAKAALAEKRLVQFWNEVNLARCCRAFGSTDASFRSQVLADKYRELDMLDDVAAKGWRSEIERIRLEVANSSVTPQHRNDFYKYSEQVARKWNSLNAREESLRRSYQWLTILCACALGAALLLLKSPIAVAAAVFGALGGLTSAASTIRTSRIQFRNWRLDTSFVLGPVIGAIVATVLLQWLISGLSPIYVQGWTSGGQPSISSVAAISFAAGLSERFILSKLYLVDPPVK